MTRVKCELTLPPDDVSCKFRDNEGYCTLDEILIEDRGYVPVCVSWEYPEEEG